MWLNGFCRLYSLFRCHRIRLVDRQEGYIDILYLFHFRDIFRVSGNVNPGAAHSEDISVVTSLGMEFISTGSCIISRYCFQFDFGCNLQYITIFMACPLSSIFWQFGLAIIFVSGVSIAAIALVSKWSWCSCVIRI